MLEQRIINARDLIETGRLVNEAAVSSGVVLPILDALGWPAFDPSVVAPEYGVGGRRVDFALLTKGTPAVFVEVKQPGLAGGADLQLFEYAFHEGVPIAILTDGATWSLYLPAMQGNYEERRVYLLDLLERNPKESAKQLERYLRRDAVESGDAFERARRDYQSARQRKGAAAAIPQAWANIIAEPDSEVFRVLAQEVESVSGFAPAAEDLQEFVGRLKPRSGMLPQSRRRRTDGQRRAAQPASPVRPEVLPERGVTLEGEFYPCRSGRHVLTRAFELLIDRDPSFAERFASLPVHGRRRRYLAREREALYPGRPDLSDEFAQEVVTGWWLSTNHSLDSIDRIIRLAAEAAGLAFGEELQVRLRP